MLIVASSAHVIIVDSGAILGLFIVYNGCNFYESIDDADYLQSI
jgi:hypothetical protein